MTAVIPGTHYTLGEDLIDDLPHFIVTCTACAEHFTSPAILWCEERMENHWATTHPEKIR